MIRRFRFLIALGIMFAMVAAIYQTREATMPVREKETARFSAQSALLISNPQGCVANELWIDGQDWWTNFDGGVGEDFGHLHTAFCWPYRYTLTTAKTLTIIQKLHDSPGTLETPYIQVEPGGTLTRAKLPDRTLANCLSTDGIYSNSGHTCTWTTSIVLDPDKISGSGWKEFRIRGRVREPNGGEQVTTTGLQMCVRVCTSDSGYRSTSHHTETRGWYDNPFMGYANSGSKQFYKLLVPVKGTLSLTIWLKRGASGAPVTGHYVAIDTDFHNDNPGTVVKQGSGEFNGTISIDTTKLANGWHRLFLRTDQFDPGTGSVHSGVFATVFEVAN